ncbi:MAG: hypothetical protein IH989_03035 [Planctomycetes bacterium]|nr:hypothetical protein [Planctomycetota bacterium]
MPGVFLVLVGAVFGIVFYSGGISGFDPSDQGLKARAALAPGMSFSQACDLTGDPKKFRIINRKVERIRGEEIVFFVPSPRVKCSRERINERLAEGSLPYGFVCTFTYSASVAFTVEYDKTGAVVAVTDAVTQNSIFDM